MRLLLGEEFMKLLGDRHKVLVDTLVLVKIMVGAVE